MSQADGIRTFVLDNYIEPARRQGHRLVTIRAGDVAKALRLQDRMPAIGSALRARKFEWRSNAILVDEHGPRQGSNLYLTFAVLRAGEVPLEDLIEAQRFADRVGNHVMERFMRSARAREERVISLEVGDVHDALGLENLHDVVGAVLKGQRFQSVARVRLVAVEGVDDSSEVTLRFEMVFVEEPIAPAPADGPCAQIRTAWARRRPASRQRIETRVKKLVADFDRYVMEFDRTSIFTGPSVYFHLKTIDAFMGHRLATEALDDDQFWDLLYATLTSWGLHRMGRQGAKLADLPDIRRSFLAQRDAIQSLQDMRISELSAPDVPRVARTIWHVMENLTVGRQRVKLIANSKALHHLLPDLVPPIDREYTLRFFYNQTTTIGPREGRVFVEIYPVLHYVAQTAGSRFPQFLGKGMHTSETKIIDNAIVGFVLTELKQ